MENMQTPLENLMERNNHLMLQKGTGFYIREYIQIKHIFPVQNMNSYIEQCYMYLIEYRIEANKYFNIRRKENNFFFFSSKKIYYLNNKLFLKKHTL